MEWLQYVFATLFFVLGGVCVVLVVVQLPGTWALLGLAALLEYLDRLYLPDGEQACLRRKTGVSPTGTGIPRAGNGDSTDGKRRNFKTVFCTARPNNKTSKLPSNLNRPTFSI